MGEQRSQRSARPFDGGRVPPCLFSASRKMRGAERRQALVRIAAPDGPSRERTHLRSVGDGPAHDAGWARLWALCCGVLLAVLGYAFCGAFRAAVGQLLAGGPS